MRIDFGFDLLSPTHPRLGPDRPRPVSKAGNEAQIFADMLLADPAGRDDPARRQGQRFPVDLLQQENSLRMMPQGAMPEIRQDEL